MAKYSNYITMQNFIDVYDITSEKNKDAWKSFIPTKQFCDLLRRSLDALTSSEASKRKGVWVRGTFGTGKSHASAVVKHLLCDDVTDIEDYYKSIEDKALRERVKAFRDGKRYFPIVIKGVEGAYDVPRFKLTIQREVKRSLAAAGYKNLLVHSDFETAIEWIQNNPRTMEDVLDKNDKLKAVGSTSEKLINLLRANNMNAYMALEEALNTRSIFLTQDNISDWLVKVEEELEQLKLADGMIVFWDEFTSVMETIKSDRINVLQNIAEKAKNSNLFLFLISHRVEQQLQLVNDKDVTKMNDRFDTIDYKMDEISTYLIMRHTYLANEDDNNGGFNYRLFHSLCERELKEVMEFICKHGSAEERSSIEKLFPLHPYTAYLCSVLSNYIGSANRSVVRFMHDENAGFAAFINNDHVYSEKLLLTPEWLWDFFSASFETNANCSLFVTTFNNHHQKVADRGEDYLRVFKAILLLNALGVNFSDPNSRLVPSEEVITYMFGGDQRLNDKDLIARILEFFDENDIIRRNILGEYKISVVTYNPQEMLNAKNKLKTEYKVASDFLAYSSDSRQSFINKMNVASTANSQGQLYRPCELQIYSCEEQEAVVRSKLMKYAATKPNYLHVCLFFSITDEARDRWSQMLFDFSKQIPNVIMVLPEEVLSESTQTKFIDALATKQVAKTHYNESQEAEAEKQAKAYILQWFTRINNGSHRTYCAGEVFTDGIMNNVYTYINRSLAYKLFPRGFEHVKKYRLGGTDAPATFFKSGGANKVIEGVITAQTRDKMIAFAGSNAPAKQVFMHDMNNLVNDVCELTEEAKNSEAWLVQVCQEVDKCMATAKKKYQDRFSLSEILEPFVRPPFGFFQSPANFAAMSYALRAYKDDLFVPSTSQPVSDEKLAEMIADLFKLWQGGESPASNKLLLRFGSPEESKLTSHLKAIFDLKRVPGVNEADIKSLAGAKWGIQEFCKIKAKQPLWTLKYCSKIQESQKAPLEKLIALFEQETPTIDKIKAIVPLIEKNQVDLHDLFIKTDNYLNGFVKFLDTIEDVSIEADWMDDLATHLSNYLPSEIAFWKEADVRSQVMSFYLKKTKVETKHVPSDDDDVTKNVGGGNAGDGANVGGDDTIVIAKPKDEVIEQAKGYIHKAVMPNMFWQKVMLDLLEEHPEVAQFITENLNM